MKFKERYNISNEFDDIFSFSNEEEELEHDAQMLTYKFLDEIEKCYFNGPKIRKKDLAKSLGKSTSFISQLYSGDKLLNFPLLAKIQKALNINFEIKAKVLSTDYIQNSPNINIKGFYNEPEGFWVWKNKQPNYSSTNACCDTFERTKNKETAA